MVLYLKYDPYVLTQILMKELMGTQGIAGNMINAFEIELEKDIDKDKINSVLNFLDQYNIEINKDHKAQLVIQIKNRIVQMIRENSTENITDYLSRELNYSYRYLSNIFQEATFCSIENFVIFQKIEYAKKLAINENLTLTEIAYKMNYCSVAHLSKQFKNTTGLTFVEFQKIIAERQQLQTAQQ